MLERLIDRCRRLGFHVHAVTKGISLRIPTAAKGAGGKSGLVSLAWIHPTMGWLGLRDLTMGVMREDVGLPGIAGQAVSQYLARLEQISPRPAIRTSALRAFRFSPSVAITSERTLGLALEDAATALLHAPRQDANEVPSSDE